MYRPTALTLALCLASLLPLQTAYADNQLPQQSNIPTTQTASTNTATIQANISTQTPPVTEETAPSLIQITSASIPLSSKLQKSYEAYRITIQSDYPTLLKLQSGAINNAQSGNMAFEMVRSGMTPVYCTLLLGLAGFVLIGVPMLIVRNGHNEKSRQEALHYTNQIPLLELAKGQTLNFDTLVPLGQKPDISLTFKDPHSGLLFSKRAL